MPDYSGSYYVPWYSKRATIKNVIIENGVTSIGNYAFRDCFNLTSVTIPESVTSIGNYAFYSCSSLTAISIPNSATSIGSLAFYKCSNLISITIPNSLTSIGENAFSKTKWDENQPDGLVYAGSFLLKYKGTIPANAKVEIKDGTKGIADYAFFGRSSLTSISIPNSVTSIGNYAFQKCSGLTTVSIPNSVTSIGNYAFQKCSGLTSVSIPNSVTSIGEHAFSECSYLTSATIGKSVKRINSYTFYNCSNLTSVTMGNSVTQIGMYAFSGCIGLTSITLSESVTSIGDYAFYGCSDLVSINIPNSVTVIGKYAFCDCSDLVSINIPNSVTSIGKYAFAYTPLSSVFIPESVNSIGEGAFRYCTNLKSVNIPNSMTKIEYQTFDGCWNLISVNLGNSVTNIGDWAFNYCNELPSITIPKSVKNIGSYALSCSRLTSITCEAIVPPVCASNSFQKFNIPLFVPANSINAYKAASVWRDFTNIQAIPDNLNLADAVVAMINAIGKVEYTDACKDKIDEANNAYNALTADQKVFVTNLDVLTNAQQTYDNLKAAADKLAADKAKADPVIAKINAIGKVEYTDACKNKIDDASKAYEALTDDQKALVRNLDVLTTAQQTYDNLKTAAEKLAADKAKADPVITKINAIGKVEYTDACKDKIDDANNAYNDLTADQKALVSNLDVLTTAKQTYDNLKTAAEKLAADKAKAEPVIAKINAIGKVEYTDACKNKIDEANNAYNALTADQKALVSNLDVLTTAQQTYESLKAAAEKLAADKVAFDKYKSEQKDIIEALIKEDDSDAVKDIIKKAISDIDALGYEEAISLDDNKEKLNTFVTSVNETVEKQRAEDQKTTRIEELELAEKANIFDLNGRKITNSMLKSGLYIRNGKKIVVK